jgi:hypothetical protein
MPVVGQTLQGPRRPHRHAFPAYDRLQSQESAEPGYDLESHGVEWPSATAGETRAHARGAINSRALQPGPLDVLPRYMSGLISAVSGLSSPCR